MSKRPFVVLSVGILLTAIVVSPAHERPSKPTFVPASAASEAARVFPALQVAASGLEAPGREGPLPLRSKDGQGMGTGRIDVTLPGVAGVPVEGDGDDPRDVPVEVPAGGIEYRDGEPVDEWAAMSEPERAAAIRKKLEDDDAAPDSPSSTLRTPPPKDPRAVPYDAKIQARFAEVEQVRQRSNPAPAPPAAIDATGIATVVSGEGQVQQELRLAASLDQPLRDSRGTAVTPSTVLGLLEIRDMYIGMAEAMASVFDSIGQGDIAFKRARTQEIYGASLELARLQAARDSAKARWDGALRSAGSIRGNVSEEAMRQMAEGFNRLQRESEAATAAFNAAMDRFEKQFPEMNVLVDEVPLWRALAGSRGESVAAQLDRVGIYNRHLQQGAADLRARAAAARTHVTMDQLMPYGRPEFVNVRDRVRLDGRAVGSGLPDLLMNQVEAIHAAYDIHVSVDTGWTKVLLAVSVVGIIAGGWVILPLSAVAYGCLGVSVVDVTLEGSELVVRYGEARAMEEATPLVGWRHVVTAQDRERAAIGGTVLAAIGVGVDTAVIRSIRVVGPSQCGATEIPAVSRAGEVADAGRAAVATELKGLRADDIAHWRAVEAAEIERARGYGVTLQDATDAKLARLDDAVLAAERAGIPRSVIDDGLNRIRETRVSSPNDLEREAGILTPFDHAIRDFHLRMVIAEAMQKGLTIVSRIEDSEYLARLGGSRANILILEPIDLNRMLGKAATDRGAGAVTYTPQEADLARQILEGEPGKLYVFDPQQVEGGLYKLVHPDDAANLQRVFGPDASRPATIVDAPPTGPPPTLPPRRPDSEADTHLDMMRPRTQVLRPEEVGEYPLDAPTVRFPEERTPTQVLRPEEIGEYPLDVPTVRFPADPDRTPTQVLRLDEIGEYPLDAPTVRFPARADDADRTPTEILRPGEVEAAFREADAVRPGPAHAAGAGRAAEACPPVGPCGSNEIVPHSADPPAFLRWYYGARTRAAEAYEMVVRALGAENVDGIAGGFAEGRARVWSWPEGTSYLDAKRMDKFGGHVLDPGIVAKLPPDAARAYNRAHELGPKGLPSDLDIPVDDAIDVGRLEELGREIYDQTGVLIEFTRSRIRGGGGAQARAGVAETPAGVAPVPAGAVNPSPSADPASATTIDLSGNSATPRVGGPSGQGGPNAGIEVVILSTAGSTGPVMEAFFVNHGEAVRIEGEGIVLEPVAEADAATLERIEQIREASLQGKPVPPPAAGTPGAGPMEDPWTGASVVRVVLDAYCLEADLAVPTRGMLYRIADPGRQTAFGSLRPILEASERLHEQGALHPPNDPEDYFHSIRQWAIWADEKDMDAEEFEDAFAEHARKNITASGQAWTPEVERVVRDFAPRRWEDVEAVLEAAGVR